MPLLPFRRPKPSEPQEPAGLRRILSLLAPDQVHALGGLPVEAVVGALDGETLSVESFRANPAFLDFLHGVIRRCGPGDPDLQRAALEQHDGSVCIIDLRTPEGPQGRVPPEDIIGAFAVRGGEVVPDSYVPNERYRAFTANGLIRLPGGLIQAYVDALPRAHS